MDDYNDSFDSELVNKNGPLWDNLGAIEINLSDVNFYAGFSESFAKGMNDLLQVSLDGGHILPCFSFPAVQGAAVFPFNKRDGDNKVRLDQILLKVCGGVGLTPRPYDIETFSETGRPDLANDRRSLLSFIADPLHAWSLPPTGSEALKSAAEKVAREDLFADLSVAIPDDPEDAPRDLNTVFEATVEQVIETLEKGSLKKIQAHPSAIRQWACLKVPASLCFTQAMDLLTTSIGAVWTWTGNDRFLIGPPMPGMNLCKSRQSALETFR